MESIIFEVDDSVAKAWKNSSPELRALYEEKINSMLKELKQGKQQFTDEELAIINHNVTDKRYEWWSDGEMMAEMDKSEANFRSGKDPGITWDALKTELLSRRKKMQIDFLFLAAAQKEIRKSFDWYDERSEELGDRFLEAVDNAVIAISRNPEAYQTRKGNTREFVMDVFPFIIVYRFSKKENLIYILHIFHTSRSPKLKYRR